MGCTKTAQRVRPKGKPAACTPVAIPVVYGLHFTWHVLPTGVFLYVQITL